MNEYEGEAEMEMEAQDADAPAGDPEDGGEDAALPRRPRIAIMGEFSAGKSTLSNLLLGARALPEKVTATQLPPVWITQGAGAPVRIDLDGAETPLDPARIGEVPVEETFAIRMFSEAPLLERCDLIDFPGISDPNMDADVWERVLPEADAVLWCTHATQAWRRSEAAAWELASKEVRARSLLLVTRFDKLTTDRDRARVLRRLEVEAGPRFAAVLPVSLVRAFDPAARAESGFDAVMAHLEAVVTALEAGAAAPETPAPIEAPAPARAAPAAPEDAVAGTVLPRRVRPREGARRRTRPMEGAAETPADGPVDADRTRPAPF